MKIAETTTVDHPATRMTDASRSTRATSISPAHSDQELLDAWILDRRHDALAMLVRRYDRLVRCVCGNRCRDSSDVDDAYQTTFSILAERAETIRRPECLPGWLQRVAYRCSVAATRQRLPTQSDVDAGVSVVDAMTDPLDAVSARHEASVLDEELAGMPERYRNVLVLRYAQDLSLAEIAEHLQTTIGAVRGWLQRGRKMLATRLRRRGMVPLVVLGGFTGSARPAQAGINASDLAPAVGDGSPGSIAPDADTGASTCFPAEQHSPAEHCFLGEHCSLAKRIEGGQLPTAAFKTAGLVSASGLVAASGIVSRRIFFSRSHSEMTPVFWSTALVTLTLIVSAVWWIRPPDASEGSSTQTQGSETAFQNSSGASSRLREIVTSGSPSATVAGADLRLAAAPTDPPGADRKRDPGGAGDDPFGGSSDNPFGDEPQGSRQDDPFGGQTDPFEGVRSIPVNVPTIDARTGLTVANPAQGKSMDAVDYAAAGNWDELKKRGLDRVRSRGFVDRPIFDGSESAAGRWNRVLPTSVELDGAHRVRMLPKLLPQLLDAPELDGITVDRRSIGLAQVPPDAAILFDGSRQPLKNALRNALQPLGLRALTDDDGLKIVADFAELNRRKTTDTVWVNVRNEAANSILQKLQQPIDADFVDVPLKDAIAELSQRIDMEIVIDRIGLEEGGYSDDSVVRYVRRKHPAGSVLWSITKMLDLTLNVTNNTLTVTTLEAADDSLLVRAYFLEGLGLSEFTSVMQAIETSISPDNWESLGGCSSMTLMPAAQRPVLLISTTLKAHLQIESLLDSIRQFNVLEDPPIQPKQPGINRSGGGMF